AKVVCWRELPDDAALNSRCIILPMHAVNDAALRLPDDPEIVSAAAKLQSQLLYYRLANYDRITKPAIDEVIKTLPPRTRELYLAIATPCADDEISRNFLLDHFRSRYSHVFNDNQLSAAEYSVIFALFHLSHMPEKRNELLTREIAARANRYLHDQREHMELVIRRVGAILTGYSFAQRRRTRNGFALVLEKDAHRRLHGMDERYGMDCLRDDMPGFVACHLCPDAPPAHKPSPVGVHLGW